MCVCVCCCPAGSPGGDGGSSVGQSEGGRGGQTGGPAGQERERGTEESNQERETETQDNVQGLRAATVLLGVQAQSLCKVGVALNPDNVNMDATCRSALAGRSLIHSNSWNDRLHVFSRHDPGDVAKFGAL